MRLEMCYWGCAIKELPWSHGDVIEFSTKKKYEKGLKKILLRIDAAGCNAMILNNAACCSNTKILFIDKGRFRQS